VSRGWVAVTKKDFTDAIQAKSIWVTTALFVLAASGATVLYAQVDFFHDGTPSAAGLITFVRSATTLFVPVIAVLAGYRSIAGEREDGSIRLLLSIPVSRRDVVLGKLIGRTGVVVAPAMLAYLVAAVLAVVQIGGFDYVQFLVFGLVTALYALAYVSIAVGISASSKTTAVALAAVLAVWALFQFVWGLLGFALLFATNGFAMPSFDPIPAWYVLFTRLSPSGAFGAASSAFVPGGATAGMPTGMGAGDAGGFSMPSGPFFLEEWFGFVLLLLWIVVPVALGYRWFTSADL